MCCPVSCPCYHKTIWAGCGQHIEEALRDVPPEKCCTCPREADRWRSWIPVRRDCRLSA